MSGLVQLLDRLRILRTVCGWSKAELARKAHVTPTTLSLIETGQSEPVTATQRKLADALKVPVRALHDDVECMRSAMVIVGVSPAAVAGVDANDPTMAALRDVVAGLPAARRPALLALVRGLLALTGQEPSGLGYEKHNMPRSLGPDPEAEYRRGPAGPEPPADKK